MVSMPPARGSERPHKTRREYVPVGSGAASLLRTVLSGRSDPLTGYSVQMPHKSGGSSVGFCSTSHFYFVIPAKAGIQ